MVVRVLIVDDDEDARVLLTRALAKGDLALELATAGDGREALAQVAAARPDAVITDVMMPHMNGFELCAALRAAPATATVPVIMVTALEDEADRARGLAAGADAYMTKPFNWRELIDCLVDLLGGCTAARSARR